MVVLLALGSAVCYAAAMVFQHHGAAAVDEELWMQPSLLVRLGRRADWWAGVGANIAGFLLRGAALTVGSLVAVQALVSTSLLLAVPVSARWHRQHVGRRAWLGAVAVVIGLVWFVWLTGLRSSRDDANARSWLLVTLLAAAVTAAGVAAGRRWPSHRAAVLGVAGGALLAVTASMAKAAAHRARHGIDDLVLGWPLYALGATTAVAVLVVQSAFASGPLIASLPPLMATEVVASVVIGFGIFHEAPAGGAAAGVGAAAALAIMTIGVVVCARAAARLSVAPAPGSVQPVPGGQ